jgi:predicted DNA-binding protein
VIRCPWNDAWLSFRLPAEDLARLDEIATAQERTRSDLMREVVEIVVSDARQAARASATAHRSDSPQHTR